MGTTKGSGRRRVEPGMLRRSIETKQAQTGRRFGRRLDGGSGETFLPQTMQPNVPKKKQVMASRFRTIAFCAFLLVCFGVVTSRQKRGSRQRLLTFRSGLSAMSGHHPSVSLSSAATAIGIPSNVIVHETPTGNNESPPENQEEKQGPAKEESYKPLDSANQGSAEVLTNEGPSSASESAGIESSNDAASQVSGATAASDSQMRSYGPLPDQIESYSRSDLLAGERPVCRISNACILANGMISLPVWMQREDRLLRRCGLGPHTYHTGTEGPKGSDVKHLDADLAQLVRLVRFKEPSSTMTDFWTDSVLHAAFLFDTFSSSAKEWSRGTWTHCISTQNSSDCDQQLESGAAASSAAAAVAAGLKPALFVPKKVLSQEHTWERGALAMLDGKYGPAATNNLLTDSVINKEEKDKATNVTATCFRSLLVGESKFKDLPPNAFDAATSPFFARSGIDRTPRQRSSAEDACEITIGVMKKSGARALTPVDALRTKIANIAATALPSATVTVEVLEPANKDVTFSEQTKRLAMVDILLGGTSSSLANMAFMRVGSSVFEVFPFAWQPPTFGDLAHVLGLRHKPVFAIPQTDEFRACMEHEVFQLRKQGRLTGEANPKWVGEAEQMWATAAGEFALSGQSPLLLNSDTRGVSNFHTRSCARHQSLDFNVDDVAKAVLLEARNICNPPAATA